MIKLTKHAIERYMQRMESENVTFIEAQQLLMATYEASETISAYSQVSRHVPAGSGKVMEDVEIMLYDNMLMVVIIRDNQKLLVTCHDYAGSVYDTCRTMAA